MIRVRFPSLGSELSMLGFLKKMFRKPASSVPNPQVDYGTPVPLPPRTTETTPTPIRQNGSLAGRAAVDEYFRLSSVIEAAKSRGDYKHAIEAAKQTFPLMPAVIAQMKREFGAFDIATSHAIHTASVLMAVMEDGEAIRELRRTLDNIPELHKWRGTAEDTQSDLALVTAILSAVKANPGVKQSELRKYVSGDGRRIGTLVAWLDKGGRLHRVSKPRTYALYLEKPTEAAEGSHTSASSTGDMVALLPTPKRTRRSATRAATMYLERLPYLRLPKAPPPWEERTRRDDSAKRGLPEVGADTTGAKEKFSVFGAGWKLVNERKLKDEEKPNPAYRMMFPTNGTTVWLDTKGRRDDFPTARTVVKTTAVGGEARAERGLPLDVYRSDVNSDGSAMLFMAADGTLHAYDDTLETLFLDHVANLPEYQAQVERFGISETQLKNHTRCVSIAADRSRFLVTIVDEAWCYDIASSKPLWGVRFPTKEGWNEIVSERSERTGVSAEIHAALALMELSLPTSPQDVAQQYKVLAKQWHPDKNQGKSEFTRKFQDLNSAMELLTGMDLSALSRSQIEHTSAEQLLHKIVIPVGAGHSVTLTFSLQMSGSFAADWIYAANFAHQGEGSFLASYSGRVVEMNAQGQPLRVFDVGSVPTQITQTPAGLYILTPTRLYILHQGRLQALVDVYDQGRLVVTDRGFGLLQSKLFRWFTPYGMELGGVQTKDPIRRVFYANGHLTIETRSHSALVEGNGAWW